MKLRYFKSMLKLEEITWNIKMIERKQLYENKGKYEKKTLK